MQLVSGNCRSERAEHHRGRAARRVGRIRSGGGTRRTRQPSSDEHRSDRSPASNGHAGPGREFYRPRTQHPGDDGCLGRTDSASIGCTDGTSFGCAGHDCAETPLGCRGGQPTAHGQGNHGTANPRRANRGFATIRTPVTIRTAGEHHPHRRPDNRGPTTSQHCTTSQDPNTVQHRTTAVTRPDDHTVSGGKHHVKHHGITTSANRPRHHDGIGAAGR